MALDKLQPSDDKPLPLLKLAHLKSMVVGMAAAYGKLEDIIEEVLKRVLAIQQNKELRADIIEQRVIDERASAEGKAVELLRKLKESHGLILGAERWWQRDSVLRRSRFYGEYPAEDFDDRGQQRSLAVEQVEQVTQTRWMTELAKVPYALLAEYARDAVAMNNPALVYRVWSETQGRNYGHNSERARTVTAVGNVIGELALPEVEQAQRNIEEASGLMERATHRYQEVFRGVRNPVNKIKQGLRARQRQAAADGDRPAA